MHHKHTSKSSVSEKIFMITKTSGLMTFMTFMKPSPFLATAPKWYSPLFKPTGEDSNTKRPDGRGFWPSNLHTDPAFNAGGGAGDKNSGVRFTGDWSIKNGDLTIKNAG